MRARIFLGPPPTDLASHPSGIRATCPRHPTVSLSPKQWCRNFRLLSIDYAFRPRLRSRLTLGGVTWPRKPYAYGERASHSLYRYSCPQNHLHRPRPALTNRLVSPVERSPTPVHTRRRVQDTSSVQCLFPLIIGARMLDQ